MHNRRHENGQRFDELRYKYRLNHKEWAKRTGVNKSIVSKIAAGSGNLSDKSLELCVENLTPEEINFITGVKEKPKPKPKPEYKPEPPFKITKQEKDLIIMLRKLPKLMQTIISSVKVKLHNEITDYEDYHYKKY